MIEVLLVDDESYVTESLAKTIPWQELGVHKVYQACSPAEALQLLEEQPVDIMVTDIRMPEMDGLQLIERVRERWPHIRSMLLTGYSDFDYAKKAIQLKAVDYLLKPVHDEAFIQSIAHSIDALKDEWDKAERYHQLLYAMKSDYSVLRQNMMHELLLGRHMSDLTLADKLEQYEVRPRIGESAVLLAVQLGKSFAAMDHPSVSLMEYAVGNIAEELFSPMYNVWHSKAPHDCLAIIVSAREGSGTAIFRRERLQQLCLELQQKVGDYLKGEISIVISEWFTFPEGLAGIYRNALMAMYRQKREDAALLFIEDMLVARTPVSSKAVEELYRLPTLIHLLESGQWDAARLKIRAVFSDLAGTTLTREELYEAFLAITNGVLYVVHKQGLDMGRIDPDGMNMLLDRSLIDSPDKLGNWADRMLDKLEAELTQHESAGKRHIIKQVQELVMSDLGADTSVKTIADRVFLHPVYLSKLYKSETGESLGDYIIRMRMERAVYMLKSTNKRIYEITTELGYQNPQYFSKIFKKHYGVTPGEFRDPQQST